MSIRVFHVMLGAVLRRFHLVTLSLKVVALRGMRVMIALGVIAFFVGLGGFLVMMMLGVAVMLGGLAVMFGSFRVAHGVPRCWRQNRAY